jgi:hypothetical protein
MNDFRKAADDLRKAITTLASLRPMPCCASPDDVLDYVDGMVVSYCASCNRQKFVMHPEAAYDLLNGPNGPKKPATK